MVVRLLLRNWLSGIAGRKVRDTVEEAARQQFAAAGDEPRPAAANDEEEISCEVGVVFALPIEAGGLEDRLADAVGIRGRRFRVTRGTLHGRRLAVVCSGAGVEAARRATEALIEGHHPQWLISAGFAGGLSADLARHDVLMVDQVVDPAGKRLSIDLKVDPAALAAASGVSVGRLLTADHLIRTPHEKKQLGETHQALAVDMETFAVAEACRRLGVRLLAVRMIIDTVADELPPDVERLMKRQPAARKLGTVLGTIWNRPASVKDLYTLKENALVASNRLARFLISMIDQLTPRREGPK